MNQPNRGTPKKRVLDVGQCDPDHATICHYVQSRFGDVEVVRAHALADALDQLHSRRFDLVLVNRKLDVDYSDGLEIIKAIKRDPELADVPVMMVTNYPEHQDLAVAAGAERGFGKLEYDQPETEAKLRPFLA